MTTHDADVLGRALADWLTAETGFAANFAEAPVQTGDDEVDFPYYIVHLIDGAQFTGSLGRPWSEVGYPVQIDAVGIMRDQTAGAASRARVLLLDPDVAIPVPAAGPPSMRVNDVAPDGSAGGPVAVGRLWQSADRYRVTVTS